MYTRGKGGRRGDDPRRPRLGPQVPVWSLVSKAAPAGGRRRAGPPIAANRRAGSSRGTPRGQRPAAAPGGAPAHPALNPATPLRAVVFDVGEGLIDATRPDGEWAD